MRHYTLILYSLLITLCTISCSNIDEDERLIYVEPAPASRAVLIEDFTGQRCSNCPEASDVIHQLQEEYGDSCIIPVAIHCQPMGVTGSAAVLGLMNDESAAYGNQWGVSSQPIGLVNRVGGLLDRTQWMKRVREDIQLSAPVEMSLYTKYEEESGTLTVTTNVTALYDIQASLQVWLVQDSIVALQTMPNGSYNRDYIHMHVFRSTLNGMYGEQIAMANGEESQFTLSKNLNEIALGAYEAPIVPRHCSVVAFIYTQQGVQQVTKAPLFSTREEE